MLPTIRLYPQSAFTHNLPLPTIRLYQQSAFTHNPGLTFKSIIRDVQRNFASTNIIKSAAAVNKPIPFGRFHHFLKSRFAWNIVPQNFCAPQLCPCHVSFLNANKSFRVSFANWVLFQWVYDWNWHIELRDI